MIVKRQCGHRHSQARSVYWAGIVNACSYIARYPVCWTCDSEYFTLVNSDKLYFSGIVEPLIPPWQTCSFQHHIDSSGKRSASLQLLCKRYSLTYFHRCLKPYELEYRRRRKMPKLQSMSSIVSKLQLLLLHLQALWYYE